MPNELNFPANKNIGDVITLNDLNFVWDGTSWNSRPKPSDEFFIAEGGNVGIGTTTPGTKLQVTTDDGRAEFITEDREAGVWIQPYSGSIELWNGALHGGESNFGDPYIDFNTYKDTDFDCRIIKNANHSLHLITGGSPSNGGSRERFVFTENGELVIGGATQLIGDVNEQYNAPDPAPFGKLDVRGDLFVSDRIRFGLDHSDQAGSYPNAQITATRKDTFDTLQLSAGEAVAIYTGNDYSVPDQSAVDPITGEFIRPADFIVFGSRVGIGTSIPTRGKLDIRVPIAEDRPGAFIEGGLNVQPQNSLQCLRDFTAGNYLQDFDSTAARSYIAAFTAKDDTVSTDLGGVFIGTNDNNGDENALLVYNQTAEADLLGSAGSGKSGELFRVRTTGDTIVFGNLTVKEKPAFEFRNLADVSGSTNLNTVVTYDTLIYNQGMGLNGAGHASISTGKFTAPIDGIYHFSFACCFVNGDGSDNTTTLGFEITNNTFGNNAPNGGTNAIIINPRAQTTPAGTGAVEVSYTYSKTIKLSSGAVVGVKMSGHNAVSPVTLLYSEFSGHQVG